MTFKEIRYRIPEDLHQKFRMICVENKLSFSKQMHELVRKFVEIQEQNNKLLKGKK